MAIVVRRDLNMTPGLLAAQVLHIGMEFIRQKGVEQIAPDGLRTVFNMTESEWITAPYVAVLAVDTPEELGTLQKMAEDEKLPVRFWKDVIPSKVLEGRFLDCVVGISIGPADADAIKKVTGTLPLF